MISTLFDVRRLLADMRRKFLKRKYVHFSSPMVEGLPESLEQPLINQICQEHFGGPLSSVVHFHLSGWKSYGAYRLIGRTTRGSEVHLIYKVDFYSVEEIPALARLPVQPGLPEYHVYSQPGQALAPYLPKVYLAEEILPGRHYRYILEDLRGGYERPIQEEAKIRAAGLIPIVQQALQAWAREAQTDGLIVYGPDFSRALIAYARTELELLQQKVNLPSLNEVLNRWQEITALHLHPEFLDVHNLQTIHGDTNYSNIHLHKNDPRGIKLVDWEWAGFGEPLSDLASLLKGVGLLVEMEAIKQYRKNQPLAHSNGRVQENRRQFERLYIWCQMERALLDAAFLSAQVLHRRQEAHINLDRAVEYSLKRILHASKQLAG